MAIVQPTAGGSIDTLEGSHESIVILIAMIIIFSAAAYFTGRLYGRAGMIAVIAGFLSLSPGFMCLVAYASNQSYRSGVAR
ncbi:MAG: hypothetical protein ACLP4V_35080 [Methylocella sp.]